MENPHTTLHAQTTLSCPLPTEQIRSPNTALSERAVYVIKGQRYTKLSHADYSPSSRNSECAVLDKILLLLLYQNY